MHELQGFYSTNLVTSEIQLLEIIEPWSHHQTNYRGISIADHIDLVGFTVNNHVNKLFVLLNRKSPNINVPFLIVQLVKYLAHVQRHAFPGF